MSPIRILHFGALHRAILHCVGVGWFSLTQIIWLSRHLKIISEFDATDASCSRITAIIMCALCIRGESKRERERAITSTYPCSVFWALRQHDDSSKRATRRKHTSPCLVSHRILQTKNNNYVFESQFEFTPFRGRTLTLEYASRIKHRTLRDQPAYCVQRD